MKKKIKKRKKTPVTKWTQYSPTSTTSGGGDGSYVWYFPPKKESFLSKFLRLLRGE